MRFTPKLHVVYGVYRENTKCTKIPLLHCKVYVENTKYTQLHRNQSWGHHCSLVQLFPFAQQRPSMAFSV